MPYLSMIVFYFMINVFLWPFNISNAANLIFSIEKTISTTGSMKVQLHETCGPSL